MNLAAADDDFWLLTDYHDLYLCVVLDFAHVDDVSGASGAGMRPLSREPCTAEVRRR
jgi:hypothetical protein